jgi:ABC-type transport system substrate-binding protein
VLQKVVLAAAVLALSACTNNPYPEADQDKKVLYTSFSDAPKTLDPAVAYTVAEHVITGNVFDTLLEYHYLRRPYQLMPGLAEAVPEPQTLPGGRQLYRFKIRRGVLFHEDPCFAANQAGPRTREVVAADVAFELARKIPGVRPVDGGKLENSRIVEQITALLIAINIRAKKQSAGIRITGV